MNCPHCNVEMSKKWRPSAAKASGGSAMTWACGVCGCQLTKADMKRSAKQLAAEPLEAAMKVGSENELTTIAIQNGVRDVFPNSEEY